MGIYDFTFYNVINRNAVIHKDKDAWLDVIDGRTLTFFQVKNKVDRLACGLQKAGVQKGDRIAVLGKNSLEYFLLYGAASAIGAIVVPLNWRLSPAEVEFNLKDCEPVILFADMEYQNLIKGLKEHLIFIKAYYNLEREGGDFQELNLLLDNPGDFKPEEILSDDGFIIMYTAAVAGRPRGALLSHENILLGNMHFSYRYHLSPQDVHLSFLPLFHAGGLFMATTSFHAGALNVNMKNFNPGQAVQLIEEKKVSILMEFTPMLSSILDECGKANKNIASLRIATGIETPETIERYQQMTGGTFYCLYGQTETSCVATFGAYDDRKGSSGKTIPLAEVRLVDDYDHPVPAGDIGEITMKGPMVFKGYWNLPEDTAYTFREGWHHTGDLGRFDEDGFLWYAGRKPEKELIKPGGENVYPAEVEKVILQHPAVEKTVVFGVPDPKWKEGIKAVCKLKKGESIKEEDLIDFVGARIARFKKPQYVAFVTDFPLLEDGSPDRARIKKQYGGSQ
ncbi:MAG: AMP-binding protein [Deltaproteobacteria bacterium]|nr:AMP-binding protein [Deltaproteobacteria bacterium]